MPPFIALSLWLCSLPPVQASWGPIPRPDAFCRVVAAVALEFPEVDARWLAASLDVVAAHESAYRTHPPGLNDHGASKGAWQTPSAETPDDAYGQARVAARWMIRSAQQCPDHPLSLYASGHICGPIRVADYYSRQVMAALGSSILEGH